MFLDPSYRITYVKLREVARSRRRCSAVVLRRDRESRGERARPTREPTRALAFVSECNYDDDEFYRRVNRQSPRKGVQIKRTDHVFVPGRAGARTLVNTYIARRVRRVSIAAVASDASETRLMSRFLGNGEDTRYLSLVFFLRSIN